MTKKTKILTTKKATAINMWAYASFQRRPPTCRFFFITYDSAASGLHVFRTRSAHFDTKPTQWEHNKSEQDTKKRKRTHEGFSMQGLRLGKTDP